MFYGAGNYTNKAWSYMAQTLRKMILVSSETTHDIFSNAKDIYRRRFDPGGSIATCLRWNADPSQSITPNVHQYSLLVILVRSNCLL